MFEHYQSEAFDAMDVVAKGNFLALNFTRFYVQIVMNNRNNLLIFKEQIRYYQRCTYSSSTKYMNIIHDDSYNIEGFPIVCTSNDTLLYCLPYRNNALHFVLV